MADFKTHLSVAAVGSGALSTACLGAGISGPSEVITFTVVGTVGGLLPDIDSDHSSPIKLLFTALGLIAAGLMMFSRAETSSILELWAIGTASYLAVRYVAWNLFGKMTVHRGVFHSLLAALFFWFVAAAMAHYWFGLTALMSWSVGFFLFFGYMVHLSLDELFSVDLVNTRLKRSFGTALKLYDYGNFKTSILMAAAVAAAYWVAPSYRPFYSVFANGQTYHDIAGRFLPDRLRALATGGVTEGFAAELPSFDFGGADRVAGDEAGAPPEPPTPSR